MSERSVYLMRGLPSCGKSYRAKQLAAETGVVCETDEYFYQEVGDDPERYDYDELLLPQARDWNFARFLQALKNGSSPVIVDRGNGLNAETQRYACSAIEYHYQVELIEPQSEWWQEIRVLLKYKDHVNPRVLDRWADALAAKSKAAHRVPATTIRHWMNAWKHDLTIEEILSYDPAAEAK